MNCKLLTFFATQIVQLSLGITSLVFYPYFQYNGICLLYYICNSLYLIRLLGDYKNYLNHREIFLREYSSLGLKFYTYTITCVIAILLILLTIGDKYEYPDIIKLYNTFYLFFNIFYIVILNLISQNTTITRVSVDVQFKDLVKGVIVEEELREDCSICLTMDKGVIIKLECTHLFHLECLKKSYDHNNKKCPLCRVLII